MEKTTQPSQEHNLPHQTLIPNLQTLTLSDPLSNPSPSSSSSSSDPLSNPSPSSSSDPLSNPQFLNDLCFEISSLQDLASRGSWRSITDKITRARTLSLLHKPHEHLIYLSFNVLALTKLKRFNDASKELDTLEDLETLRYKYETYPDLYPTRSGSMVPFALRWLHAEVPMRLGKREEGFDRLYSLLGFVRKKLKEREEILKSSKNSETLEIGEEIGGKFGETLEFASKTASKESKTLEFGEEFGGKSETREFGEESEALEFTSKTAPKESKTLGFGEEFGGKSETLEFASKTASKEPETLGVCVEQWRKREAFLINSISSHHLSRREFDVCLTLLRDLVIRGSGDPVLFSKLGYIQLQLGDVEGAKGSFNRVEEMMKDGRLGGLEEVEVKNLVNRNKALVYMVGKDYVSAVREYDECIERDSADVVALNNKALCLMYLRDLSDSIKVLESALERIPTFALNETLVVNLCSMYELAYVSHSEIKKTLSNWIAKVAPDDFDSACTRA